MNVVQDDEDNNMDTMDAAPIPGCTGIVLDNLEEDMTFDDIKAILKKVCPGENFETCTLQPTGSLRSKIVQNLEVNLIPKIAKKVDKTSFKGRLIFCKPFVPRTPPKENPSTGKNETNNSTIAQSATKQVIPGLPEIERVKALKTKDKKDKKGKEGRKGSKEEATDMKNLSQKDSLLKPKAASINAGMDDALEKFQFSDQDDDNDEFEDSKEELDDDIAFTTPITLKSAFARTVAMSETKVRSRSTSVKRQLPVSDVDENKKRAKSLKSGLPAPRKSLKK